MNQIKIIGTSHIAEQSVKEIEETIARENPEVVAIELDSDRAQALLANQKSRVSLTEIFQIGARGYLFAKIGQYVQQKLGKMVGMAPGADMKAAITAARRNNIKVALIDQPIKVTLKNFSKALTWKERWRFFADIIKGIIQPRRQMQELGLKEFNLHSVPKTELIEKMIQKLEERYPSVYKTLVMDRNRYMARKLIKLSRIHSGQIIAVVGAGHKKGMEELLSKLEAV